MGAAVARRSANSRGGTFMAAWPLAKGRRKKPFAPWPRALSDPAWSGGRAAVFARLRRSRSASACWRCASGWRRRLAWRWHACQRWTSLRHSASWQ